MSVSIKSSDAMAERLTLDHGFRGPKPLWNTGRESRSVRESDLDAAA